MPALLALTRLAVWAQTTTTTEVPRVVGEPLPGRVVVLAGVALLVVIVGAGVWARSRMRRRGD